MNQPNRNIVIHLLILFLLHFYVTSNGQRDRSFNFNNIDLSDGFPNNQVNAITQDEIGFMWYGTNDGLVRYGSPTSIQVFKKGDIGLESSAIRVLHSGIDSMLWIGTIGGGLTKYDIISEEYTTYNLDDKGSIVLSNNEIVSLHQVGEILLVGTESGLNMINTRTDSIYQFSNIETDKIDSYAILNITQDDKGWLWIGTWDGGFYLFLPHPSGRYDLGQFRQFIINDSAESRHVWKILHDSEDRYWIATHGGGLYAMHLPKDAHNGLEDQNWKPTFTRFEHDMLETHSISNNYPQDILKDQSGNIWITTVHGLNIVDAEAIIAFDFENPTDNLKFHSEYYYQGESSISSNQVGELYIDDQGLIWIGSSQGVNLFNERNSQFDWHHIVFEDNHQYNDSELINSIVLLNDSTLLLGARDSRMYRFNINSEEFEEHSEVFNSVKDLSVLCMHKSEQSLYIGTPEDIIGLDLTTNQITNYKILDKFEGVKPHLVISSIIEDSQGRIWVATRSGLVFIDKKSKEVKWITEDEDSSNSISDNSVTQILEDSTGKIWVTTHNGINVFKDSSNHSFDITQMTRVSDQYAIPINQVRCVAEYEGKLYFGTMNGLMTIDLYDHSNVEILALSKINYTINSIKITDSGILWAATSEGLFKYNINSENSSLYSENVGVEMLSFYSSGSILGPDNRYYLGGRMSFLSVKDKESEEDYRQTSNLHITGIQIVNSDSEASLNGLKTTYFDLPPDNYYLEIQYANLDFTEIDKIQFDYRLLGFKDEDWKRTTDEKVSFTNLEKGNYRFEVKSSTSNSDGSDSLASLDFKVNPAFEETLIFKLLIIGFIGLLIQGVNYVYSSNIRTHNEILRTYNSKLNAEFKKTAEANASLGEREHSMKILVSKLNKMNEKLISSNEDLEQFAYIASHDLQEPLNTVASFTSLLKRNINDEGNEMNIKFVDYISDGVDRMSALIKSILTYSLVSSEKIQLTRIDLTEIVNAKIQDLDSIILKKNVKINIGDLPTIICDGDQIAMVFYNLILNGLKFNKKLEPIININAAENETHWIFHVEDNGIGIPEEHQHRIFDIFQRLHNKGVYDGTGIGLSLCNKIIHRHDGNISVNSEIGKGTTFSFSINKELEVQNA